MRTAEINKSSPIFFMLFIDVSPWVSAYWTQRGNFPGQRYLTASLSNQWRPVLLDFGRIKEARTKCLTSCSGWLTGKRMSGVRCGIDLNWRLNERCIRHPPRTPVRQRRRPSPSREREPSPPSLPAGAARPIGVLPNRSLRMLSSANQCLVMPVSTKSRRQRVDPDSLARVFDRGRFR